MLISKQILVKYVGRAKKNQKFARSDSAFLTSLRYIVELLSYCLLVVKKKNGVSHRGFNVPI